MTVEVDSISKHFGGVVALDAVSIACHSGVVTGLIGPNGSGKSTLFNAMTGVKPPDSGRVMLDGEELDLDDPEQVANAGVVRTFQVPRVASKMTVLENVLLPARGQSAESLFSLFAPWMTKQLRNEERVLLEEAWSLLDMLGLAEMANETVAKLSGGQTKLLSIAMSLITRPRVLMLDEPTAGVNPSLVPTIVERLRALAETGIAVIVIEHNIELISDLCVDVYVLDNGRIVAHGTPQDVQTDPRVVQAYLGIEGAK